MNLSEEVSEKENEKENMTRQDKTNSEEENYGKLNFRF